MISTFSSLDIGEALSEVIEQVASVSFRQACTLQDVRTTKGYELVDSGEWESYLDGKSRKVTLRSIKARRDRLLAEARTAPRAANAPPRPRLRSQPVEAAAAPPPPGKRGRPPKARPAGDPASNRAAAEVP